MEIIRLIYPEFTARRKPPVNLSKGDDKFFGGTPFQYTLPSSFVKSFRNILISDIGVPIKSFRPMKEFITCYEDDFIKYANRYTFKILFGTKKVRLDNAGPLFLIFDNYTGPNGFYHWICDGLSKLVAFKDEIKNYTVIVPEYFRDNKFYMYTLSLFDIKNIIFISPGTSLQVKNLLISDFIAPSGTFHPQNAGKLRDFIWSKIIDEKKTEPAKGRIYISRRRATRRFITNETEVEGIVKENGFQIVFMEDYAFNEQVNLIYNAEYVVSIHGAALTHINFMRPGTNVLEFRMKDDAKNNCYFNLADAVDVNYYYQFCEGIEQSKNANSFDLFVNTEMLKKNLNLMLNRF